MKGCIYDIKRFSTDDGPGIRSVVFFKGCNMRCLWCHNPESLSFNSQIMFRQQKCIGCGRCAEVCRAGVYKDKAGNRRFSPVNCVNCGACTEVCHTGALARVGKMVDAREVLDELYKDEAYYKNSEGGITVSGGEPLLQIDFLEELLRLCTERGMPCAIETAGNVPWKAFERILPYSSLFLYDCKAADDALHRRLTGSGNRQIFQNLRTLSDAGAQIWVRTPVVPGCNDNEQEIAKIHTIVKGLYGVKRYTLLPFHTLGEDKYQSIGMEYALSGLRELSKERMAYLRKYEF